MKDNAPFADIAMMKHDQMAVMINDNSGKANDAPIVIKDFVTCYAPFLAVPDKVIDQVAVYAAALAIDALIDGIGIGAQTVLATDIWVINPDPSRTTTTATSESDCPDATKIPVNAFT